MFDTTSSFMRNAIFRYLFPIYSTQKVTKKNYINIAKIYYLLTFLNKVLF